MTKTKKTTILLLISLLIMSAIMLLFSGNNYTNIAFADSTRGNLGGVSLAQDVYSEDSDTGSSWGESDHTSYDGHIRFTSHNAASFIGYDLTNWTKGRVRDISGTLRNSVDDAIFRFTVYKTGEVSQVSNHEDWGYGLVTFKLYRNGSYFRTATVSCDMSVTSTQYCDLYLGVLSYDYPYRVDVTLQFGCDDGKSWGHYEGNWSYNFTLQKRTDYDPYISSGYVLRDNVYYYNESYYVGWYDGYSAYRVGDTIYAMPSAYAYDGSNTYTKWSDITSEGTHNIEICNWYYETIAMYNTVLDMTGPAVYTYDSNNNALSSYTNKSFYFSASDSISGVDYCKYMTPTSSDWEDYTAGTVIPSTATNGTYQFRAYDVAGNYSTISIVLDTVKPYISIQDANGNTVTSKSRIYTQSLTFSASDSRSGVKYSYIKTPGTTGYSSFSGSKTVTTEGTYSVYTVDMAGNSSATKTITIDRTAPVLSCSDTPLNSVSGKGFTINATDNGGQATIYYKGPNDSSYTSANDSKFVVTNDFENGFYYFYAIDDLGNKSSTYYIELDIQVPVFAVHWNDDNTFYVDWDTSQNFTIKINDKDYAVSTVISGENTYVIVAVNNYGFTTTETVIITHKYIVTSKKEVTCTEQGYTVYKCITCNESIVSDYVNALGHNYDSLVIPPTCTERGYTLNSCSRCDHTTMTNYVNALGHSYTSQTIEATCTENGCIRYSCTRCDHFYETNFVIAMGHNYSQITVDATCTTSGGVKNYCTVCDYYYMTEEIPAFGHSYDTIVAKSPTCKAGGERHFNCSKCGNFYYTEIPKLEHNYEMTNTETTDGMVKRTYVCTHCNESYVQEMGEQYDKVANYVEYLFQQYSPYMVWVFLGTSGIWSLVMGIFIIIANKNDEKEKAKKMLKNYFIGMIAIFVIVMAAPLLARGIAALVT